MTDYNNLNEHELNLTFVDACSDGDLNIVRYLLTSSELKHRVNIHYGGQQALFIAANKGHLDIVKYLLNSPEIKEHADVGIGSGSSNGINSLFEKTFEGGNLDVIRYFFHEFGNKTEVQIKNICNKGVILSARYGHLDVLKYLLTSTELPYHPEIDLKGGAILEYACDYGRLDMVKYILTSPELTKHIDIHINDDTGFFYAYNSKQYEILKYLIIELNIEKTERIKSIINSDEETKKLFELRNINKDLRLELGNNQTSIKRIKL